MILQSCTRGECGLPPCHIRFLCSAWSTSIAFAVVFLLTTGAALAHPHVWVTMTSELIYAADGSVTGIRHAWAFDDMFSVYALQGIESKKKGAYTARNWRRSPRST